MQRGMLTLFLGMVGAVVWAAPAAAYTSPGVPQGQVNDFAHVLSDTTIQSLEEELRTFNASTSNEIAVVTVPTLGGDYIENYAVQLFEEWAIGKKDRDNGVLILLAIEERELRIEVGYGLEGALPDSVAKSIIENDMVPQLKEGNYDGAVTAAVDSVMAATQGEYTALHVSQSGSFTLSWVFFPFIVLQWLAAILARSKSWWAGGILGAALGIGISVFAGITPLIGFATTILLTMLGLGFDYLVSNAYRSAKSTGGTPPWWAGGPGSGGSSSSGSSFGGFGGGSSGGGGASGRW